MRAGHYGWISFRGSRQILVRPDSADLKNVLGFTKQLAQIRETMVEALELGRGTCKARNAPTGSCRGKLVCVKSPIAASLGTKYVVIVTGHVYSVERNYQAVIPVYDADELEADVFPDIVVTEGGEWVSRVLGKGVERAAFVIPFMHSLWHRSHIAHSTGQVIEPKEMRAIEAAIRNHFALPAA